MVGKAPSLAYQPGDFKQREQSPGAFPPAARWSPGRGQERRRKCERRPRAGGQELEKGWGRGGGRAGLHIRMGRLDRGLG